MHESVNHGHRSSHDQSVVSFPDPNRVGAPPLEMLKQLGQSDPPLLPTQIFTIPTYRQHGTPHTTLTTPCRTTRPYPNIPTAPTSPPQPQRLTHNPPNPSVSITPRPNTFITHQTALDSPPTLYDRRARLRRIV